MARGGFRPGAGRPKGTKGPKKSGLPTALAADIRKAARKSGLTPLEYMLRVMNDEDAPDDRRDRMAIAAASFVHPRMEKASEGKKEITAEAAKNSAVGKFAPSAPPKLIVNNG